MCILLPGSVPSPQIVLSAGVAGWKTVQSRLVRRVFLSPSVLAGVGREVENSQPVVPRPSVLWGHSSVTSWTPTANEMSVARLSARPRPSDPAPFTKIPPTWGPRPSFGWA